MESIELHGVVSVHVEDGAAMRVQVDRDAGRAVVHLGSGQGMRLTLFLDAANFGRLSRVLGESAAELAECDAGSAGKAA